MCGLYQFARRSPCASGTAGQRLSQSSADAAAEFNPVSIEALIRILSIPTGS
jgi:hypothetical protein